MPEREETETRPRKWGRTFTKRGSGVFSRPSLSRVSSQLHAQRKNTAYAQAGPHGFFFCFFRFVLFVKKRNQLRNCLHFADVETEAQRMSPGHPTSPGQEEAWRVLGLTWGT